MYKKSKNLMLIAVLTIILIVFTGCEDVAKNTTVIEIKSPNGKYKAIAFIRDAGATTDFSPQVSVLKSNQKFKNESGNIFIGYHSKYIDIKWEDDSNLIVFYDCDGKYIFKKVDKIHEITVKFEKKPE